MIRELHNDLDEAADFSHWRIPAASAREFGVHSNRVNFREASRAYTSTLNFGSGTDSQTGTVVATRPPFMFARAHAPKLARARARINPLF